MGALSQRAPMGTGPRGLRRQRRCVELLHARSGAFARLPLGRGRPRRLQRRPPATVFCARAVERQGPYSQGALFGLTNSEGNHGEDVKEYYYYLDSTPTHSYMKYLYKYPQGEYPYLNLIETNRHRGRLDPEYELLDTGIFHENRYFDVFVEYAKASPTDMLIQIGICNRGPDEAVVHVLPTLWFRNIWTWWPDEPN